MPAVMGRDDTCVEHYELVGLAACCRKVVI